ncbi:helix-turn-helix domain-containing protein [Pseudarthrobacter siccitolerans]|uniref:helix-turn-helix domain-containing protein n=1 Tax=Pseudarthrobacter siccitolerans TaxID=861266 RepID=UPI000678E0C3|nr:helix-turn-helix domain-containing protein [Pseudarthrobacter siccitolerans]
MTTTPERSGGPGAAEQEWLTPKEICAQLQIPEQTFYQWRVKHVGPKAHRIGKHLRISRRDFEAWLSARLEP